MYMENLLASELTKQCPLSCQQPTWLVLVRQQYMEIVTPLPLTRYKIFSQFFNIYEPYCDIKAETAKNTAHLRQNIYRLQQNCYLSKTE